MGEIRQGRYVKVWLLLLAVARQRVMVDYIYFRVYIKITAENMVWMLSIVTFVLQGMRMTSFGPSIARANGTQRTHIARYKYYHL